MSHASTTADSSLRHQHGNAAPSPALKFSSATLPLRFITAAIGALAFGVIFLVLRPDILATYHYNQYVLAITHLFTLGWITTVIMGSIYQLVPVALETRLFSERLAHCQLGIHLISVIGMVWMFWRSDMNHLAVFGLLMITSVGLFVTNLVQTLLRTGRWTVVSVAIASSLFWLSLAVMAGFYLVVSKLWNIARFDPLSQMHAHAHLGGVGFFVIMLVGVSYKLVPMFTISQVRNARRAWASIALLNAGVAGLGLTILTGSSLKFGFAMVAIAGLALYGWEIGAMLRARKRRNLDWSLKYFVTAIALFVPVSLIALLLSWPNLRLSQAIGRIENVYGFLLLIGVLTLAILGMLYKIIPFLVWYTVYSRNIGRSQLPTLSDLYSARLQQWAYWLFLLGMTCSCAGTFNGSATQVRWGCSILAVAVLATIINFAKIFSHLVRPV